VWEEVATPWISSNSAVTSSATETEGAAISRKPCDSSSQPPLPESLRSRLSSPDPSLRRGALRPVQEGEGG
jgi:hypothetical protein